MGGGSYIWPRAPNVLGPALVPPDGGAATATFHRVCGGKPSEDAAHNLSVRWLV